MAKFNKKVNVGTKTVNKAGGVAYTRTGANAFKQEVASIVLNSMLKGDSFYESEADRIAKIEQLITDNIQDAEFLAKAMVYTRNTGNLRSVSHVMGTVLAENVKGSEFLRPAFRKSIVRPDDATELVSLYTNRNSNTMLPSALKRAIKDNLEANWDEYQLKKYEGSRNAVKLRDVVKLTHPNPRFLVESGKAKDVKVFRKLIEGTLDPIQTAQTVNASTKAKGDSKRADSYAKMLAERKLGYMAALKNIKNILEAGADDQTIDMLCSLLRNARAVEKSRVLPFRFVQAYNEVDSLNIDRIKVKKVLKAVEDGFSLSAKNVSIVDEGESVALLLDESGSMGWGNKSMGMTPFEIGKTLMASMLTGLDDGNAVGYLWADRAREVDISGTPFNFIKNTRTQGGGTDVWAAMSKLISTKTKVDKIVVITDMQMYNVGGSYYGGPREFKQMVAEYKNKVNPNVKILFWNVEAYGGGTPVKMSHDIMEMAGWSDNLLEVAAKMLKFSDKDYLVKEIESIQL